MGVGGGAGRADVLGGVGAASLLPALSARARLRRAAERLLLRAVPGEPVPAKGLVYAAALEPVASESSNWLRSACLSCCGAGGRWE